VALGALRGDALLLPILAGAHFLRRGHRAETVLADGASTLAAVSPPETTVELLREVAADHPDRAAFVEIDRRMSFAEWDRAADGVAALFLERGVRPGDVVALLVPSSIDYAVCYQAAMRLRAITTGINTRLGPPEIASILERTEPRVVVRDSDLVEIRTAFAHEPPADLPSVAPDDRVAIVWTSGTTGMPKGAVFDHRNLRAVAVGAGAMGAPFDVRLAPLPFAHVAFMSRAVGGDRKRHHHGDHAHALDRDRRARVDGARTRDCRAGCADAVAPRARPSRLREPRSHDAADRGNGRGDGPARARPRDGTAPTVVRL